jgi:hypothetical protein
MAQNPFGISASRDSELNAFRTFYGSSLRYPWRPEEGEAKSHREVPAVLAPSHPDARTIAGASDFLQNHRRELLSVRVLTNADRPEYLALGCWCHFGYVITHRLGAHPSRQLLLTCLSIEGGHQATPR